MSKSLPEGYPSKINFLGHYSIFTVAFQHGVTYQKLKDKKRLSTFESALEGLGWEAHVSVRDVKRKASESDDVWQQRSEKARRFQPEAVFSPQAHASIFGSSRCRIGQSLGEHLLERFDPEKGKAGFSEPILLALSDSNPWLNSSFYVNRQKKNSDNSFDIITAFEFEIKWVDLWLFADGSGFLAFRAERMGECGISKLSDMNRTLRNHGAGLSAKISTEIDGEPLALWDDVIFPQWLGFDSSKPAESSVLMSKDIIADDMTSPHDLFDPYQHCCKVLTFAQTPDMNDEEAMYWARPLCGDPSFNLQPQHIDEMHRGDWNNTLLGYQLGVVSGYASVRDLIPFELASVSDDGAAMGWNETGRGWQFNVEYVRKIAETQFIEAWEFWLGVAMRDSCAFVSFDHSMPISWQAESHYYPLYVSTYHLRYRLDELSRQVIDPDLTDITKGRLARENFQRFRNQFWFHEVTTNFMGIEVFDKMKIGMGVDAAYEAVKEETDEINQHVREKWERMIGILVTVWVAITTLTSFEVGKYLLGIIMLTAGAAIALYLRNPNAPWVNKLITRVQSGMKVIMRKFSRY